MKALDDPPHANALPIVVPCQRVTWSHAKNPDCASGISNFKFQISNSDAISATITFMTYENFEDLPVWKEAILLIEEVYRLTSQPNFRAPASFKSQMERAALSVSNNIAEGFERGTKAE